MSRVTPTEVKEIITTDLTDPVIQIWIDAANVIVTDALTATIQNTERLRVGRRSLGDNALDGRVDEVVMFNKALNLIEITEIYNSGKPKDLLTHSASANIISYWRMGDAGTFPTIPDFKGSNHGTLINLTADDIVEDIP